MNNIAILEDEQVFLDYQAFYYDTVLKTFFIPLSTLQQSGIDFKDLRLPGDIFGFNIKGIANTLTFFYNNNVYEQEKHIGWNFSTIAPISCSAILLL